MSVTAKSVIFDIADNYGDSRFVGIRSVEFFLNNVLVDITGFAAYATSYYAADYMPRHSFEPATSKTGTWTGNQWLPVGYTGITNQRLIVVFSSLKEFDKIVVNNSHSISATEIDTGAKNVKIIASTDAISDITYGAAVANSQELFDGVILQHVASDIEDPQTVYLAPVASEFEVILEQQYDLSGDIFQTVLEQAYAVLTPLDLTIEQIYSMVMEVWHVQYYGDTPWMYSSVIQPYGGAGILQKSLAQRWGTSLEMTLTLDQPWSMPDMLQLVSEQGYGITAAVLQKTSEQLYHINQLSTLFTSSHQAYAIAGEVAQPYLYDTKLYVDGARIKYTAIEWQSSDADYFWSCEAVLPGKEIASKCVDGAEMRIDSAGESYFFKCYGGWLLDKRYGSESYRVKGYSKSKDLSLGTPLSGDIPEGMASKIVTDLAAVDGISIDWQMADGYIQDGKLVANDETRLDVIRKLVWDAKGKLRPTIDGNLIVACEEEIAVPDYPTVMPATTINARLERISTSEQRDEQKSFNYFVVSDQLASGDSRSLVKEMIDSRAAEIKLRVTPMYPLKDFTLTHTGPPAVTIEPFGVVSEEVVGELVEIKAGSGQTSLPIYTIVAREYLSDSLGAINFAEDGLLATEISGYSLVKLTYVTKYYRWIARHALVADVQFLAEEVEEVAA